MVIEFDLKEMLGVLMNIIQVQQCQMVDLLEDMCKEIGRLQMVIVLVKGVVDGIEMFVVLMVQVVERFEDRVLKVVVVVVKLVMEVLFKGVILIVVMVIDIVVKFFLIQLFGVVDRVGFVVDWVDVKMRQVVQWIIWKVSVLVVMMVFVIWVLVWYGVWLVNWEVELLWVDIEGMKVIVVELEKKGGWLNLSCCGGEICIQVDWNQCMDVFWGVFWGDVKKGYFVILKWW